ncbi:MAG: hypothetical protein ABEJ08_00225 [Halobacteriaceae archaeon]
MQRTGDGATDVGHDQAGGEGRPDQQTGDARGQDPDGRGPPSDDTGWTGDGNLLYGGESVTASVDVDAARVLVTTHRVLVVDGGPDRPTLQSAHRPNVEGVGVETAGRSAALRTGARAVVGGGLAFAVGLLVDLDGLIGPVPTDPAGGASGAGVAGVAQVVGMVQAVVSTLAVADRLLRYGGAAVAVLGAALLATYAVSRRRRLVVHVAGGEPLELPTGADPRAAARRVEAALTQD